MEQLAYVEHDRLRGFRFIAVMGQPSNRIAHKPLARNIGLRE
jgi:hypothetical protein